MTKKIPWLTTVIETLDLLGGEAHYMDIYRAAKEKRIEQGGSWPVSADAIIRRVLEEQSSDSESFKGRDLFYSVNGLGKGVWGLRSEYRSAKDEEIPKSDSQAYLEGIEGIRQEVLYLRRTRDPRLSEERKRRDNYTCQACKFRLNAGDNKYIIDVHHLQPLGLIKDVAVTKLDDLVCLCPNCHRIAHSVREAPLTLEKIREIIRKNNSP